VSLTPLILIDSRLLVNLLRQHNDLVILCEAPGLVARRIQQDLAMTGQTQAKCDLQFLLYPCGQKTHPY